MNRKAQLIAIVLGLTLFLVGIVWLVVIRSLLSAYPVGPKAREIVDMTGRRIGLPDQPKRILSLCTSATDTIVRLQAQDRLAAIDEYSRVVPGTESATVIGKGSAISREQLVALGIDLAFVWWFQDDAAAVLQDLAIPVVRIRSGRAPEVPDMIRLVGECLGSRDMAENLAEPIDRFLVQSSARSASDRRRVFLEMYGPYKTLGSDTYTNDLLELAGGNNIAAETKGTAVFSVERLIQADPDVILFVGEASGVDAIAKRPGLAGLRAVRKGRVMAVDRYSLVAGASLPQSVEKIRSLLFGPIQP
jgi:iron complex transport system substrate-binding protein